MHENKDNITKTEWGYEVIWANHENYCAKILVFNKQGAKTPFYFQKNTHKTWFVNTGEFKLRYIDTKDGQIYEQELKEGSVFVVDELVPCSLQLNSAEGSISQVSTNDIADDIYITLSTKNF